MSPKSQDSHFLLFVLFPFRPGAPAPLQESSLSPFRNEQSLGRSRLITSQTVTEDSSGAAHFSLTGCPSFPFWKEAAQRLNSTGSSCLYVWNQAASVHPPAAGQSQRPAQNRWWPGVGADGDGHGRARGQMQPAEHKRRPKWGRQGTSGKGRERKGRGGRGGRGTAVNSLSTALLCRLFPDILGTAAQKQKTRWFPLSANLFILLLTSHSH